MKHRLIELLQSVQTAAPLRLHAVGRSHATDLPEELKTGKCANFCGYRNEPLGPDSVALAARQWDIGQRPMPHTGTCKVNRQACSGCYADEIERGELSAETGERYPVTGGIPRLLSPSATDFLEKNKKSFSLEWKYSRGGERNWGQDLEFRKKLFLEGMGVTAEHLRNKLLLDAGCGSGLLARAIADSFGAEVVGLDLASGIENAYSQNKNPRVHFIQGSVLELPLRSGMFDYVYCAGVLIHLPDTKQAFELLPRLLKPGGRLFIWVYHPIDRHDRAADRLRETIYHSVRTKITSRLPIALQEMLYLCLVGPFVVRRVLLRLLGRRSDDRTWREKMQNFIDTFSPLYVNRHTEEEVLGWFRHNGFVNCEVAYRERYGFGVRGDFKAAHDLAEDRDARAA